MKFAKHKNRNYNGDYSCTLNPKGRLRGTCLGAQRAASGFSYGSLSSDAYLSIHLYVYVNIYTYNQHITDSIYIYIYMSAINIYVSKVTVPDLVVWVRESGHSAAAERQV